MKINRRGFLKSCVVAVALVAVPMRFSYSEPAIDKPVINTSENDNYLDKFGELYGVARMYDETDDDFRKRILNKWSHNHDN